MKSQSQLDWPSIRTRAALFPEEAFQFIREGLQFTARSIHGEPANKSGSGKADERRHVTGQQLCVGLRDLAVQRYGLLARTVLTRWGIRRTDDFGTIVYSLIDRAELRAGENDSLMDFHAVYDFQEAFTASLVA